MLVKARLVGIVVFIFSLLGRSAAQEIITEPLLVFDSLNHSASNARWNADETRLLTWGRFYTANNTTEFNAQVWDIATGTALFTITQPALSTLTPDVATWNKAETLLLTSAGDAARLWDAETGALVREFVEPGKSVNSARWNADETRILAWVYPDVIKVWDAASGETLLNITLPAAGEGERMEVRDVFWNHEESQIFVSAAYGIFIYDTQSGALVQQYLSDSLIVDTAWNKNLTQVAFGTMQINSGTYYGEMIVWDLQNAASQALDLPTEIVFYLKALAWNADESALFALSNPSTSPTDNFIYVWETLTWELMQTIPLASNLTCCASWHPDGSHLLFWDEAVTVWDISTGEQVLTVTLAIQPPVNLALAAWNPAGDQFVTWYFSNTPVQLWDRVTGQELIRIDEPASFVAWNGSGTQVVTAAEGIIKIWEVE